MRGIFITTLIVFFIGNLALAQNQKGAIDSLVQVVKTQQGEDQLAAMDALLYLQENVDSTLTMAQRMLLEADRQNAPYWQAMAKHHLAAAIGRSGDHIKSIALRREAVALFKSVGRKDKMARQYLNIGNSYANLGSYDSALSTYQRGAKLAEESNDSFALNGAYVNMSTVYHERGQVRRELEYLLKTRDLATEMNDLTQLGVINFNLGIYYLNIKKYEEAESHIKAAKKAYESLNDLHGLAKVYNYHAQVAFMQDRDDSALYFLDLAIANYEKIGAKSDIAFIKMNQGQALAEAGRYEEAEVLLTEAKNMLVEIGELRYAAQTMHSIAMVEVKKDNQKRAIHLLREAIDISETIGTLTDQEKWSLKLATLLYWNDKPDSAYLELIQHIHLKDTLAEINRQDLMSEMEAKYKNEKQQLEIANLEQEKALQEVQISREQTQRYFLIAGLLGALLLIITVSYGFVLKQRDNRIIREQNIKVEQSRDEINRSRLVLELKNKEITDSITYAKRIQEAILPPTWLREEQLPNSLSTTNQKISLPVIFIGLNTNKMQKETPGCFLPLLIARGMVFQALWLVWYVVMH